MNEHPTDSELVDRWQRGDEQAATVLYERYLQKLLNLVGRHLARRFNPRLDPEDVVQSVFKSLFRRARSGDFTFQDDAEFWKLLLTVALNKVRNKVRHHEADKRNPAHEARLHRDAGSETDHYIIDRLSEGPTAAETVAFSDLFETLLETLDEQEQRLIGYRLDGYSQNEIAEKLGVAPRTVRRMFVRIRARVADRFGEELGHA